MNVTQNKGMGKYYGEGLRSQSQIAVLRARRAAHRFAAGPSALGAYKVRATLPALTVSTRMRPRRPLIRNTA